MQTLLYIIKTLYKKKWMLFLIPLAIAIIVFLFLSSQPKMYRSNTTVYTGIVSGYDVFSSSSGIHDWMSVNNSVENLINIVKAESTLETVSLKLLARNLTHMDVESDNEYLTAFSSIELDSQTPAEIKQLVSADGDEEATYQNLRDFYEASSDNYLKQLFHWNHRHYSFKALSEIEVGRIGSSDMLKISYVNDDQYIVYNTLLLVVDAFIDQYLLMRYEQTNDVVKYFEDELRVIKSDLTSMENALTDYNVSRGIINYQEQTRMVAERSKDIDTAIEQVSREYAGATERVKMLEEKMGQAAVVYENNAAFIEQLHNISTLYTQSSQSEGDVEKSIISDQIDTETSKLKKLGLDMMATKYSKEGIANEELVSQWLDALITETRTKQELEVLKQSKRKLEDDFKRFSPVGSSIKRQNREIEFCEQNYLSNLQGLNEAKLRQKNLQLTSATFRVLTPPTVALAPEKTKNTLYAVISFVLVLALLIVYVVLAELFNRLPYDSQAARQIIGIPVMGAMHELGGTDKMASQCDALVYNQLGNAVLNFLDRSKVTNIINVISMDSGEGKTTLCNALMEHFSRIDTKPVYIAAGKDFEMDDKYYLMASSIYDFGINEDNAEALSEANIVIVEYPPVSTSSFPVKLLDSSALTILVADTHRAWKDMSKIVMRQIKFNDKDGKLRVVLNRADKDAVGTFTGMMPPYTLRHRIHFAMWNLGNITDDGQRA